jgi:hypothetical protein
MEYICDCDFLCRVCDGGGSTGHSGKYGGHQSVCHDHVRGVVWVSHEVLFVSKLLTDDLCRPTAGRLKFLEQKVCHRMFYASYP